ncbi:hypothetical protein I4U23_024492 [Adineta vaga]|nr:hypothetical protein I4U23_024492 [Adineta vaga]
MANVSYLSLLSDWFRVHIPIPIKTNSMTKHRTGYAAAYPKMKLHHRRQCSCFSFCHQSKRNMSIRGCASFARSGRYPKVM